MQVANLVTALGFTVMTAAGLSNAYESHEESVRADGAAEAATQLGDHEYAAEWQQYGENQEDDRNAKLLTLALPVTIGAAGAIGARHNKRQIRDLEEQIANQQQTEYQQQPPEQHPVEPLAERPHEQ